ncbi:PaaX family transcriptional regulator C-terminal domain-containing protein [Kibdelosporangium persicum]|uniref:Phenylacetic acid degradation operon negative regulatory protein paaX n=1 Tax=Kibdelosporangium persicum TaxID=2698649 RepID=A0ABX2F9B6_9PSEU|nr:PaaX family transcriptional regulator C-terminal domain-containing protein [Kibdelosporangium persicum]NRN67956.1 Phenylacetic acid degradation operon negative regulatory protein paaX [Kibdelosporangium persicum]
MSRPAAQRGRRSDPLPRQQHGGAPQHLLMTLYADYWLSTNGRVSSAALVRLLAEFGITEASGRAALSRLSRRGMITVHRNGRRTFYGVDGTAATTLRDAVRKVMAFGAAPQPWDGTWTTVAFSIPEEQREIRHQLRTRLRWLGFAPIFDGFWISPTALADEAVHELDELGVTSAVVMRSDGPVSGRPLTEAWDLDEVRGLYGEFIETVSPLVERVRAGAVTAAEALVARTEVMDQWRTFRWKDPDLPHELLPGDWPRDAAREKFVEVYDGLGPLAEHRVRQVVRELDPDDVDLVRHHTTHRLP